ncbi:TBC1 domain family member 31 [Halotydeus destructor]|nr:TBC1 domain family member 31 [Halotydeus destructor]
MESRATSYRLNVGSRESGNIFQEKAFISANSCLYLDITNSRLFLHYAISFDGSRIVSGDHVGHVYLFDLEQSTFRLIHRLGSCVTSLKFIDSPNEIGVNLVASSAQYSAVHFLRLEANGKCSEKASFTNVHQCAVNCLDSQADQLISCSSFSGAILWDLNRLSIHKQLADDRLIRALFVGNQFIIASYKGYKLYVFECTTLEVMNVIHDAQLIGVSEDRVVFRSLQDNALRTYEPASQTKESLKVRSLESSSALKSLHFLSASLKRVVCLFESGILSVHEEDGKNILPLGSGTKYSSVQIVLGILVGLTFAGSLHVFDLRPLFKSNSKQVPPSQETEQVIKEVLVAKSSSIKAVNLSQEILLKHNQFPSKYRYYLWSKVTGVPLARDRYCKIKAEADSSAHCRDIAKAIMAAETTYQVKDLKLKFALQKTLRQLVIWDSQLLSHIPRWLTLLAFPFVKLMPRNGMFRFELIAHLLSAGLCKWHSERLDKMRNILSKESPLLLDFYQVNRIPEALYFKSLIESLFSDVILKDDWLILMDSILSRGVNFADMAVLAFNLTCKEAIMERASSVEIEDFFHCQSNLPIMTLLRKTNDLCGKYRCSSYPPDVHRQVPVQIYSTRSCI